MSDTKKLVVVVTNGFDNERSSVAWSIANAGIASDLEVDVEPAAGFGVEAGYGFPGATVDGKVVRLQPLAAFVEIAPGVDGLIHISQLSEEHVEKVKDILKVGDDVEIVTLNSFSTSRIIFSPSMLSVTRAPIAAALL